MTKTGG